MGLQTTPSHSRPIPAQGRHGCLLVRQLGPVKHDVIFISSPFLSSASFKIGTTFVVAVLFTTTSVYMVNLTVDDSTGSIINASAYDSSISIAVGSGGDAMYYEQQARVAAYASEAIINDPVVGVSGFMPLTHAQRKCKIVLWR